MESFHRQLDRVGRVSKRSLRWIRGKLMTAEQVEKEFRARFFADEALNLDLIREFRNENFPQSGPVPWLDRDDAPHEIERKLARGEISAEVAAHYRTWASEGSLHLKGAVSPESVDALWAAYEAAIASGRAVPEPADEVGLPGRLLNPHFQIPELGELLHLPLFREWVGNLLGRKALPYQTITSHRGSEQKEHSDIIHMSTYPLGYLAAVWVALEDIHPDSGPLVYYPGSHRLPYYFSHHAGIAPGEFKKRGYAVYTEKYEPFIQKLIARHKLKPAYFTAKKGDAFIWHANLIHGGSPRHARALSRKSVVCHYFAEGAVCYHDLAGGKEMEFQGLYQ